MPTKPVRGMNPEPMDWRGWLFLGWSLGVITIVAVLMLSGNLG